VLVLSMFLPDGFGDVIFGEHFVSEVLLAHPSLTWVRVYSNQISHDAGEALLRERIHPTASTSGALPAASRAYASQEAFEADLQSRALDELWTSASFVFLAPWVFGIHAKGEAVLLSLAKRVGREFWATGEYGRGMGHIYSFTGGLGHRVPSGWRAEEASGEGSLSGGVFKSILSAPVTGTDWRQRLASRIRPWPEDAADVPRLWWAYGRKDSAHVHAFRLAKGGESRGSGGRDGGGPPEVVKLIPVSATGEFATGRAKTSGELLGNSLMGILNDPTQEVDVTRKVESEVAARVAGQLSELLIHILTRDRSGDAVPVPEVIVAPNADVEAWSGFKVVRITALELVGPSGKVEVLEPSRPVYLAAESVPRLEMRSFLAQCEPSGVIVTGDQSLAEAVLLGLEPLARPDAKVQEWEFATAALREARVGSVPDLGETFRELLRSPSLQARVRKWSEARSRDVEAMAAQRLGEAQLDSDVGQILMRSGMFG